MLGMDISFGPVGDVGLLLAFATAWLIGFLSVFFTAHLLLTKAKVSPYGALLYSFLLGIFPNFYAGLYVGAMLFGAVGAIRDYLAHYGRNPYVER